MTKPKTYPQAVYPNSTTIKQKSRFKLYYYPLFALFLVGLLIFMFTATGGKQIYQIEEKFSEDIIGSFNGDTLLYIPYDSSTKMYIRFLDALAKREYNEKMFLLNKDSLQYQANAVQYNLISQNLYQELKQYQREHPKGYELQTVIGKKVFKTKI